MNANSWRPAVAARADHPRVREVSLLGFLKIVGTCALVLIFFGAILTLLAARRPGDLPSSAENAEAPPLVTAADFLPPKAGGDVPRLAEIERAKPVAVAVAVGDCDRETAGPGLSAVCGPSRPPATPMPPEQEAVRARDAAVVNLSAQPSQPLTAAAPAVKPRQRPPGHLALTADAADNLPATPPNKLVTDRHLGTRLLWSASPEAAAVRAQREGKLLFLLHLSGNFELPEFT